MSKFEIEGPNNLKGEIAVYGAKNAAMKMIAACVLIQEKVILENVPDILDIQTIINILTENGAEIKRDGHKLEIDTTNLADKDPNRTLVKRMRGSVVLIGPYLARFGKITVPQPGGCAIGVRPLDDHFNGFRQLDTQISEEEEIYQLERKELSGKEITLCPSVTATENMIMAQVLAPGVTVIRNVAKEPQIVDLCNFLNHAGAKISGAGTSKITIEGVEKLKGINYKVMADPFEAATFICMAIITQSDIKITNCNPKHLHPFLDELEKSGAKLEVGEDFVKVMKSANLKPVDISSYYYPGFSTDMLPQTAMVLSQAEGTSHIKENLFENRLGYLKELSQMGANVKIIDAHQAEITGPAKLTGKHIDSLDLRAGATMILAGLIAEGTTIIDHAEIVDRGYEKIESRLQKVGAKIKRIE